jgi:hypothetical protein
MRQAVDDTAEHQQREKSDDHHGQKFHRQNIAEVLYALEISKDAVENGESAQPESQTYGGKKEYSNPMTARIAFRQSICCGNQPGPQ